MEEMVIEFFNNYGWQLTLIACSGIFILGILKFFNVFKKIDSDKQKYAYAGVSSGFAIIGALIYLLVTGTFTGAAFGITAVGIFTINQTLYSMYENYGLRTLFQKLGYLIVNLVAKGKLTAAEETYVKSIGEDITDETETTTETEATTDDANGTVNVSASELECNN